MDALTAALFKKLDKEKPHRNFKQDKKIKVKGPAQSKKINKIQRIREKLAEAEWQPIIPAQNTPFLPKGWRTITLRWFAFELKKDGASLEIIERILFKAAKEICYPPMGFSPIRDIINQVKNMAKVQQEN